MRTIVNGKNGEHDVIVTWNVFCILGRNMNNAQKRRNIVEMKNQEKMTNGQRKDDHGPEIPIILQWQMLLESRAAFSCALQNAAEKVVVNHC